MKYSERLTLDEAEYHHDNLRNDDVLQRVKDGALKSKMTPNNFRKHLINNKNK